MKTKLLATALATLIAVSPAIAETLKMSHVRPQDATIDVELRSFATSVAEATGGSVEIQLFPASATTPPSRNASVSARSTWRHSPQPPPLIGACRFHPSPIWLRHGHRRRKSTGRAERCAR